MKLTRSLLALTLCFSLGFISFLALPVQKVTAQDAKIALQRGFRTGYSDGYMAGYRDSIDALGKDYSKHGDYAKANRAYNKDYGTVEDYSDGYKQGFESGYDTGFEKRSFDAEIPTTLARRGIVNSASGIPAETPVSTETASSNPVAADSTETTTTQPVQAAPRSDIIQSVSYQTGDHPVIIIPRDTELILELQEDMSTERNRPGDKFFAKVIAPSEISGATIEGRVEKIEKPGRIKKRSGMLLSFDKIIISETRWSNFDAILVEVLPVKGDNVKRVDGEGSAVGKSTIKPDAAKVGVATGAGAGIGAIAGGPVGAAVGAGVGAAFGVGAVIIERGKHINLRHSQQLRIKTSYETQIR